MAGETGARLRRRALLILGSLLLLSAHRYLLPPGASLSTRQVHPQCLSLNTPLDPPPGFTATRTESGSDRFVPGTRPTLIKNAKILTGARNGTEVVFGDVLLDKGVILTVGYIPEALKVDRDLEIIDADGKWVSPGLVDAHSHLGVDSAPELDGASDGNSHHAPIQPWLRSIDGLNTHDDAYKLTVAGGVTTAQILPGSANNIGGQAFLIKLRPTAERSTSAMILEPPETLFLNTTRPAWRHMKHACGENPDRVYGQTRMDAAWGFRQVYNEARKLRDAQDAFCAAPWDGRSAFPEDLQWEALVDVLRGRVKLSVHCYEAVDLDALVRLSNEFKFPIASIHHAGETYLVPDLLKRAWGNLPAIALFASNFRKKREAYRGSEFAPRILADNRLPVIMKSDHPVLNSRYLMYEAQQAHYYSLNTGLAIASVTSTPANALGVGWRVGTIAEGYDADIVLWDSHPLALGATPIQVFIDGIPQLMHPAASSKPDGFQHVPQTPSWEKEVRDTIAYEGLPPLAGRSTKGTVAFVNVRNAWVKRDGRIHALTEGETANEANLTVIVHGGRIACAGSGACGEFLAAGTEIVDLEGGALAPGLTTFGSDLGLSEIMLEASTTDGPVFDALTMQVPSILGHTVVRAVDGLQFGGRNTLYAYRAGVTTAIVAPMGHGFLQGLGTAFDVGAPHALAAGAIVQDETSLHISLYPDMGASVSTQIAALRRLLFEDEASGPWMRVREGQIPLVIRVDSADIMATLLHLKAEYEARTWYTLTMTFTGAAEAHLLAAEIAAAHVSVILSPARPYPRTWDSRRILPGPPLTADTATTTLLRHGVNVGLGVSADYDARNVRFEIAWAALDANGSIDYPTALALGSTNIDRALGLKHKSHTQDDDELVVFRGGDMFDFESKVIGVVSARKTAVELF
ncbi:Composite domain of metallo-dependent hydrolase [Mycena sanguinolenta]|uniref:Composite domain of metallo-dependent hydrolase n=1 Tax=Mycena sanguinolenta TaxID=230812 RepID=A0A8H7D7J3_9AGAR|nr:Composite domain of metallo-dependent hydrolase [Mycena sanguinolenta]